MKCYCGNTEFKHTQNIVADITISLGETVELVRTDDNSPDGPFRCTSCGSVFAENEDKDHSKGWSIT